MELLKEKGLDDVLVVIGGHHSGRGHPEAEGDRRQGHLPARARRCRTSSTSSTRTSGPRTSEPGRDLNLKSGTCMPISQGAAYPASRRRQRHDSARHRADVRRRGRRRSSPSATATRRSRASTRSPPDIVLADVGMPGQERLRGRAVHQAVAAARAHSGRAPDRRLRAGRPGAGPPRSGCDGVLAKPFEPQLVIGRVKELLGRPKRSRSAPAALGASPAPPSRRAITAPAGTRRLLRSARRGVRQRCRRHRRGRRSANRVGRPSAIAGSARRRSPSVRRRPIGDAAPSVRADASCRCRRPPARAEPRPVGPAVDRRVPAAPRPALDPASRRAADPARRRRRAASPRAVSADRAGAARAAASRVAAARRRVRGAPRRRAGASRRRRRAAWPPSRRAAAEPTPPCRSIDRRAGRSHRRPRARAAVRSRRARNGRRHRVATTAERLVREEIERIKSTIK